MLINCFTTFPLHIGIVWSKVDVGFVYPWTQNC